eukprot:gene3393-13433_t
MRQGVRLGTANPLALRDLCTAADLVKWLEGNMFEKWMPTSGADEWLVLPVCIRGFAPGFDSRQQFELYFSILAPLWDIALPLCDYSLSSVGLLLFTIVTAFLVARGLLTWRKDSKPFSLSQPISPPNSIASMESSATMLNDYKDRHARIPTSKRPAHKAIIVHPLHPLKHADAPVRHCFFDQIDDDALHHLISYIEDEKDLLRFETVSKKCRRAARDDMFWKRLVLNNYAVPPDCPAPSWRLLYRFNHDMLKYIFTRATDDLMTMRLGGMHPTNMRVPLYA